MCMYPMCCESGVIDACPAYSVTTRSQHSVDFSGIPTVSPGNSQLWSLLKTNRATTTNSGSSFEIAADPTFTFEQFITATYKPWFPLSGFALPDKITWTVDYDFSLTNPGSLQDYASGSISLLFASDNSSNTVLMPTLVTGANVVTCEVEKQSDDTYDVLIDDVLQTNLDSLTCYSQGLVIDLRNLDTFQSPFVSLDINDISFQINQGIETVVPLSWSGTGGWTVNSDCTGSWSGSGSAKSNQVAVNQGELYRIEFGQTRFSGNPPPLLSLRHFRSKFEPHFAGSESGQSLVLEPDNTRIVWSYYFRAPRSTMKFELTNEMVGSLYQNGTLYGATLYHIPA